MKKILPSLLLCLSAFAEAQNYVFVHNHLDSGILSIDGNRFSINTVNAVGNLCEHSGIIKDNMAKDNDGCIVRFQFAGNHVKLDILQSAAEACRLKCGMNARFDTDYRKEPPMCSQEGTTAMEKDFQTAYRGKKYRLAADIKERYLNTCGELLVLPDWMHTLNDLAVSWKNAGNKEACLSTLDKMSPWLKGYQPSYIMEEEFKKETKAANFNRKQCSGK